MEILRILPKAWLSFIVGKLASIELPAFLSQPLIHWFVNRYSIDTSVMKEPLSSYKSISALFTRELKAGVRKIEMEPVSPVDGTVRSSGEISEGLVEQIKGIRYPLSELLKDTTETERFQGGYFVNLYLSPKDYHRIHSPVSGTIRKMTHIPGKLWPVNDWSIKAIPDLFTVNERVVTYITTPYGEAAVVMVGATNVGKMTLSYHDLVTNQEPWKKSEINSIEFKDAKSISAGDQFGVFHLGSSVVVLLDASFRKNINLKEFSGLTPVVFGSTLITESV